MTPFPVTTHADAEPDRRIHAAHQPEPRGAADLRLWECATRIAAPHGDAQRWCQVRSSIIDRVEVDDFAPWSVAVSHDAAQRAGPAAPGGLSG